MHKNLLVTKSRHYIEQNIYKKENIEFNKNRVYFVETNRIPVKAKEFTKEGLYNVKVENVNPDTR